jgi:hypothetical protein
MLSVWPILKVFAVLPIAVTLLAGVVDAQHRTGEGSHIFGPSISRNS